MTVGLPKIAILISGNGSNMDAIIAAVKEGRLRAEIVLIASDNPAAPGLARAKAMGLDTVLAPYGRDMSRAAAENQLISAIKERRVDWVILAGFMRVLSPAFVGEFQGRIVNIHPSLLPSFAGAHAIKNAISAGAEVTGVTIHIVDDYVDHGPIIAQEEVPILSGDTEESLAIRIHAVEHRLYPATLETLFHEDV